ncbi:MAG: hypothetical protein E7241_02570 [Lachnospiraceae bacterium]|nr:hypothetical protein [Lachnospiraceae bacterium]
MNISGINGNSIGTQSLQFMMNQGADSYSKGLQEQITNAQKQMQELGDNKEMSSEEKMKRRQEIQQQISDLQNQLRQHQIEQRKENQQKSDSSENDKANAGMKDIISAGSSLQQIKSQGAVNSKAQDRARVLESEIKTDSARGVDTSRKQEEIKSNTGWQMTDEYLHTEPVKGLYKPGKDEDGNPKIDYVDPNKELSPKSAKAQESSEEPENSSSATTDTDRVDREIEKLKEKKARLQQEVNSADESEKQRLQQELLQVEAELAQKDNDAYRRQNAVVS